MVSITGLRRLRQIHLWRNKHFKGLSILATPIYNRYARASRLPQKRILKSQWQSRSIQHPTIRAHTGGSKHLPTRPFVTIDKTITNKQKTTNHYVDTTMEDG